MRVKLLGLVLLAAAAIAASIAFESCKARPALCAVCEREIHPGMKATLDVRGRKESTCCIACALHFESVDKDASFETVTDYATAQEIAPDKAVYLYAPDIQTCGGDSGAVRTGDSASYMEYDRCQPAVLAFRNQQEALKVQKMHGGKLVMTMAELRDLFGVQRSHSHH